MRQHIKNIHKNRLCGYFIISINDKIILKTKLK